MHSNKYFKYLYEFGFKLEINLGYESKDLVGSFNEELKIKNFMEAYSIPLKRKDGLKKCCQKGQV
jgi:hypothetical protein